MRSFRVYARSFETDIRPPLRRHQGLRLTAAYEGTARTHLTTPLFPAGVPPGTLARQSSGPEQVSWFHPNSFSKHSGKLIFVLSAGRRRAIARTASIRTSVDSCPCPGRYVQVGRPVAARQVPRASDRRAGYSCIGVLQVAAQSPAAPTLRGCLPRLQPESVSSTSILRVSDNCSLGHDNACDHQIDHGRVGLKREHVATQRALFRLRQIRLVPSADVSKADGVRAPFRMLLKDEAPAVPCAVHHPLRMPASVPLDPQ